MFNKKATASQDAPKKDSSVDKAGPAPAADQPAAQPNETPAKKEAPARKS